MEGYYDYEKDLCNCNPPSVTPAAAGVYDFMDGFCVCGEGIVGVCMQDLEGNEATSYPVNVYNVNEVLIGLATTKSQYRNIWNSDPVNQALGTLDNGSGGPFCFSLAVNPGQTSPGFVLGDPTGGGSDVDEGIYGMQYGSEYE